MKAFCTSNNILNVLSGFYFLLLFPGFFFYHYAVARGYILPVLGGYFSIVSFSAIPLFAIFGMKSVLFKLNLVTIVFFTLILLDFSVSIVNFYFGYPVVDTQDMFLWSILAIVSNVAMFMVGRFLYVEKNNRIYFMLLLLMFLTVFFNIGDAGIFHVKTEADSAVSASVSTYQGFGRSILVVSLFLSAVTFKVNIGFYFILLISLCTLFLNGARTEFSLYIGTLIIVYFLYISKDPKLFVRLLILVFLLLILAVTFSEYIPQSRMLQLLDLSSASSAQARSVLMAFSIQEVFKDIGSVLFGSYGAYTSIAGVGGYPHNVFSVWVNLGLTGFILYLLMFIFLWSFALIKYHRLSHKALFKTFLFFLIYTTAAILFSKVYSYALVGFVVGIYAQLTATYSKVNDVDEMSRQKYLIN